MTTQLHMPCIGMEWASGQCWFNHSFNGLFFIVTIHQQLIRKTANLQTNVQKFDVNKNVLCLATCKSLNANTLFTPQSLFNLPVHCLELPKQ